LGLVTAQLPSGEHRVHVRFEATTVRWAGLVMTGGSGVLLIGACVFGDGRRRYRFLTVLLVAGFASWLLTTRSIAAGERHPDNVGAAIGESVQLVATDIDRASFRSGQSAKLRLYWF